MILLINVASSSIAIEYLLSFEGMEFPVSVQRKYPLLSIPPFVVGLL